MKQKDRDRKRKTSVQTPESLLSDDIFYPKQRRLGRNDSVITVPRPSSALSLRNCYSAVMQAPPVLVSSNSNNSNYSGLTSFSTDDTSSITTTTTSTTTNINESNKNINKNNFFANCDFTRSVKQQGLITITNKEREKDEEILEQSEDEKEDDEYRDPNGEISNYFSSIYVSFNSNHVFQPRFDTITEAESRAKSYTFGFDDYRIKKPTKGSINNFMRLMKNKHTRSSSISSPSDNEQSLNGPNSV